MAFHSVGSRGVAELTLERSSKVCYDLNNTKKCPRYICFNLQDLTYLAILFIYFYFFIIIILCIVMYKTIFVINIIIYMCLQHSNVL